jgi:hypothetical protein
MQGMVAYARIAGFVLLGIAVVGAAGWDWGFASVSCHAGADLFFLLVGFSRLGTATVRQMVGGLGVLLALVNGAAVLVVADRVLARHHRDHRPGSGRREHPGCQVPARPARP